MIVGVVDIRFWKQYNLPNSNTEISNKRNNALFAVLVFTLPVFFGWGIQSIWWIKLATAIAEMAVVVLWLKSELQRVRKNMVFDLGAAELQDS